MAVIGIGMWQLLALLVLMLVVVFPIAHVLASKRSHGGAKIGWLLAIFIFSLLAYIPFLIVTQKQLDTKKQRQRQMPNK